MPHRVLSVAHYPRFLLAVSVSSTGEPSIELERMPTCKDLSQALGVQLPIQDQMPDTVFLFDVDNTLLDNDHVTADMKRHLQANVGEERSVRYWQLFETLRAELGYADYLGALQRYRLEHLHEPNLLAVSYFLMSYPFANRLFPNSIDAVQHVAKWGRAVILSDGDVVFQPQKVYRSGLYEAFDGNVLIYVHKEQELRDVEQRYPASHYVLVDDKLRILHAVKEIWKERVTTVFVRQGHYAQDTKTLSQYPAADITIDRIGNLLDHDFGKLSVAAS